VITEPELTGGSEEPEPVDVVSDGDWEPRPPVLGSANRRLWVVGLGGILVASAVWAAGLYAYGPSHHSATPDMHGYRLADSPCAGDTLKPLIDAVKATNTQSVSPAVVHLGPALDQIRCTIETTSPIPRGGGTARYEIVVTVDLHKKTDPGPEFEDQRNLDTADLIPVESTESVPDLGDGAYLLTISQGSQQLKVLHGGAVFTVTLNGYTYLPAAINTRENGSTPTDLRNFQPALIGAVRNVMKGQK
jgi:hypothetical protein